MAVNSTSDPILSRFRAALDEMYGDKIERVVLFGSRARGDAHSGSDYDVAVFLKELPDRWSELERLADLRVKLIDDTGAFFDVLPYPAAAYAERSPLMREIRLEGLDLMTPETAQFLEKAEKLLQEAEAMLGIGLNDAAGRTAYLAGFHAAQAFISEKTGRTVKTHKGVHTEFQRLTKGALNFPTDLRVFLSHAYNLKAIADYETGPGAEVLW